MSNISRRMSFGVLSGLPTAAFVYPGLASAQMLTPGNEILGDDGKIRSSLADASRRARSGVTTLADGERISAGTAGFVLDAQFNSFRGFATIDATGLGPAAAALRIDCSIRSEFGASYGFKGTITGNLRLRGPGPDKNAVGIAFDSNTNYASAQLLVENAAIYNFETGLLFSNRAYNSLFVKSEVMSSHICAHWPSGGQDNGERNSFIGCTFYNSHIALAGSEPNASFYFISGSIDYTRTVAKAKNGFRVSIIDSHIESNIWDGPLFSSAGFGSRVLVRGGVLVSSALNMPGSVIGNAEDKGSLIEIDGPYVHNLALTRKTNTTPTSWFSGTGNGYVRNIHAHEHSLLPDRLHENYTSLADPSFEADQWRDLLWISRDSVPIEDRHKGTNLSLLKTSMAAFQGEKCLSVSKKNSAGSPAAFGCALIDVRPGEKTMTGFRYRAGKGEHSFTVERFWARLDRYDANGLPIWFHKERVSTTALTAQENWKMDAFARDARNICSVLLSGRVAPYWATHFFTEVIVTEMASGDLLLDDMWVDRF